MPPISHAWFLRLFGDAFEVLCPDGCTKEVPASVPGLLLARLALQTAGKCSRSQLIELFWPLEDQELARGRLRTNILRVHQLLGPDAPLLVDRLSIGLDWSRVDSDYGQLHRALKQSHAQAETLCEATRSFDGRMLEQFSADWVGQRKRGLVAELVASALKLARQEPGEAIVLLDQAQRWDVLNEEIAVALATAQAAIGERAAGLQSLETFRRRLRQEVGLNPGERFAACERSLATMAGNPSRPAPPLVAPSTLIGREDLLLEVEAALAASSLVTLTGIGGAGKTRLAVEVARLRESGKAIFVDLSEAESEDDVLHSVLGALEVPLPDGASPKARLLSRLADLTCLLILDNCEGVLDGAAEVASLIARRCPAVRMLATSRKRLGIQRENVIDVGGLALPGGAENADLQDVSAVRMLLQAARTSDQRFGLTAENAPDIVQLVRAIDGLPLAIELAAARLRVMTIAEIASHVTADLDILTTRHGPERQRRLRAVIEWSIAGLSEEARGLLEHLSVFAGGFTLRLASMAVAPELMPASAVTDALQELVEDALVQRTAGNRFRVLESIRATVQRQMSRDGRDGAARERHLRACLDLFEPLKEHWHDDRRRPWCDHAICEIDNLRAALHWAEKRGGGDDIGLRLACSVWPLWYLRGSTREIAELLCGIRRQEARQSLLTAELLVALSLLDIMLARYDSAEESARNAIEIAQALTSPLWIANGKGMQAEVAIARRDSTLAISLYRESLALYRSLGDLRGEGVALQAVGRASTLRGDHAEAVQWYHESLDCLRKLGVQSQIAALLNNLADSEFWLGEIELARGHLLEALEACSPESFDRQSSTIFVNLGLVWTELGDLEQAEEFHRKGLQMRLMAGDLRRIARSKTYLGVLALATQRFEEAERWLAEAIKELDDLDERFESVAARLWMARLEIVRGDVPTAGALVQSALANLGDTNGPAFAAFALEMSAQLASLHGNPWEAAWLLGAAASTRARVHLLNPRLEAASANETRVAMGPVDGRLEPSGAGASTSDALKRAMLLATQNWAASPEATYMRRRR